MTETGISNRPVFTTFTPPLTIADPRGPSFVVGRKTRDIPLDSDSDSDSDSDADPGLLKTPGWSADRLELLARTALSHAALKRTAAGKPHADEALPLRIAFSIVAKRDIVIEATDGFLLGRHAISADLGNFLRTDVDFIGSGVLEELGQVARRFER